MALVHLRPLSERSLAVPVPIEERSSFVGRESELAELARRVTEHRLVTLVGAPGMGKTRLALRHAVSRTEACSPGRGV